MIAPIDGYMVEIDEEDYIRLVLNDSRKWCAYSQHKDQVYFIRSLSLGKMKKTERLHRLIAGAGCKDFVDHADGNTLNLSKRNLRICGRKENSRNSRLFKNNTSGYKGVSYKKDAKKFWARIMIDGKSKSLGFYYSAAEAHEAYKNAALKYFGEYARFA